MNEWTEDIESILENVRINSILFSNYHKERFYVYKSYLKYFKLPLIFLSSINSIVAIGLVNFVSQEKVSVITCLLSLISAVIASVELYLGVQRSMEVELLSSRSFLLLAYEIFKTTSLARENRSISGKVFLDDKFAEYLKLVEAAKLIHSKKLKDALAPLPSQFISNSSVGTPSSNSDIELALGVPNLR
jgi:hypothetical protein